MKASGKTRFVIFLTLELIILVFCFALSLSLGSTNLFKPESDFNAKNIFLKIRLPRSILAVLSGFLLAGSGCIFQGFFRNPLAESGVMGITSGATLGAVCSFLVPQFFIFSFFQPITIFAFLGAILAGILVFALSSKASIYTSSVGMILTGTALGTIFSSLTSIIILADQKNLHAIYVWILGSFSGRGWTEVKFIALPALLCFVLFFFCARFLNVLSVGEESAVSLGLNFRRAGILVLITGALSTACSVCCGGTIGFVGLVCPHILRKLYGENNRYLVPLSTVAGGILLLLSDTLSRVVISPQEIPVGIITSIIGAPIFISILCSKNKV